MALSGNMIHDSWSGSNSTPSIVNYAMFCSVFAMVSLFFLIPATLKESFRFHAAAPLALDTLNNIFWFCAAIAFAAELGAHSCTDYVSTHDPPNVGKIRDKTKSLTESFAGLPDHQQDHQQRPQHDQDVP